MSDATCMWVTGEGQCGRPTDGHWLCPEHLEAAKRREWRDPQDKGSDSEPSVTVAAAAR